MRRAKVIHAGLFALLATSVGCSVQPPQNVDAQKHASAEMPFNLPEKLTADQLITIPADKIKEDGGRQIQQFRGRGFTGRRFFTRRRFFTTRRRRLITTRRRLITTRRRFFFSGGYYWPYYYSNYSYYPYYSYSYPYYNYPYYSYSDGFFRRFGTIRRTIRRTRTFRRTFSRLGGRR